MPITGKFENAFTGEAVRDSGVTGLSVTSSCSVDVVRFAVLGLGAGGVYALTAQGVVLIYRGSGVVNFAQGAIGMIGAYVVYLSHEDGVATPVALALGVGLGAAIGAATHLLVMRPLRHAPAVSRLVATLGILTVCLALGEQLWGHTPAPDRQAAADRQRHALRRRRRRQGPAADPRCRRGRDGCAHGAVPRDAVRSRHERGGREPAGDIRPGHLAGRHRHRQLGAGKRSRRGGRGAHREHHRAAGASSSRCSSCRLWRLRWSAGSARSR